jgi:hypothetical protein
VHFEASHGNLGPVALVVALLALVLTTCVWASQTPTTTLQPPIDLSDPVNIEAGRQMFNVAHFGHRDHSDRSIVISEIGRS